jgi:hypothetical protein
MTIGWHCRCLVWFCLLWANSFSAAQVITIRVINAKNGHPLPKKRIKVSLRDEKNEKGSSHLQLETDVRGEARFALPDPVPTRLSAVVLLKSRSWQCRCSVFVATQDAVRKGAVAGQNLMSPATPVRAEPGQIVFVAGRRPFLEELLDTLLAPLME